LSATFSRTCPRLALTGLGELVIYCAIGVSDLDLTRVRNALRYIGLGWYVAICLVAGVLLGLWADSWLGTRPLFLLVGLFLGIAGAFLGLLRVISRVVRGDNSAGGKAKEDK